MVRSSKVVFRCISGDINKMTWPIFSAHLVQQCIQAVVTISSKITCHLGKYSKRDIGLQRKYELIGLIMPGLSMDLSFLHPNKGGLFESINRMVLVLIKTFVMVLCLKNDTVCMKTTYNYLIELYQRRRKLL